MQIKAELDQITKGLEAFKFYNIVKCAPLSIKEYFVHKPVKLTAEDIFNLFKVQFSEQGSSKRELEEDCVMKWIRYTQEIESENCTYISILH